jgi:hypothetical protein
MHAGYHRREQRQQAGYSYTPSEVKRNKRKRALLVVDKEVEEWIDRDLYQITDKIYGALRLPMRLRSRNL